MEQGLQTASHRAEYVSDVLAGLETRGKELFDEVFALKEAGNQAGVDAAGKELTTVLDLIAKRKDEFESCMKVVREITDDIAKVRNLPE